MSALPPADRQRAVRGLGPRQAAHPRAGRAATVGHEWTRLRQRLHFALRPAGGRAQSRPRRRQHPLRKHQDGKCHAQGLPAGSPTELGGAALRGGALPRQRHPADRGPLGRRIRFGAAARGRRRDASGLRRRRFPRLRVHRRRGRRRAGRGPVGALQVPLRLERLVYLLVEPRERAPPRVDRKGGARRPPAVARLREPAGRRGRVPHRAPVSRGARAPPAGGLHGPGGAARRSGPAGCIRRADARLWR